MTDYTWTGAISTDSATAGNWSPAAVPTSTDNVIFDTTVSVDCVWTLSSINNITLDATTYNLILDTSALTITGVFHLDGNIAVDSSRASVLVKFTGSGETLITFDDETSWVNGDTDKAKTTFEILGTANNIMFQDGEYPIVKIGTGTTVSPHVPSAPNNTYTETDFYQLTFANTGKFAETSALVYSSDPKLERSKVFRIRSIGTWSPERFEGGKAIWIFYATTAGFELPLSGSNISTATSFEGKVAQIKVVATTIGQKIKIPPGPHYMEKLTIDVGVMCVCDRNIAELHMTNRPIIDGAWQFVQITDGIYRSAKEDMILPITHGGTGQKNAQDAINALTQVSAATNEHVLTKDTTTGDAIWKAASGGGGGSGTVTSVDMSVPTGFSISGNPITASGTLALAFDTGYALPTSAKQTQWDTAYGWGDHSTQGYLTVAPPETDPIFTVSEAASFVAGDAAKLASIPSPETCVVRLSTSVANFTPTSAYTLVQQTGNWDDSSNSNFDDTTGLYTVPSDGVYSISWNCSFRFAGTNLQASRIFVNGSTAAMGNTNSDGSWPIGGGSILLSLSQNDTVGLYVYIGGTGATLVGDNLLPFSNHMSIHKVSN